MHRLRACLVYNSDQNNLGLRKIQILDSQEMQNVVFSANYATFSFLTDGAIVKPVRKHNITEKYLQHDLKIKIV